MAKLGYQELVNAIIRPPRAKYKMEALGPPAFNFLCQTLYPDRLYPANQARVQFGMFVLGTRRTSVGSYPSHHCMHGNSSARVEVIPQLFYLLSLGVAAFAFDFASSGKADGDFVSLGYYEREDLSCIVAHLRATNVVGFSFSIL